jgi:hypothetical protein
LISPSSIQIRFGSDGLDIEMSGVVDGAIVKYTNIDRIRNESLYGLICYEDKEPLEVKIDMKSWQNFLGQLFNSGIREWKNGNSFVDIDGIIWKFEIFNQDIGDTLIALYGCGGNPPNWFIVEDLMYDFIKSIIRIPLDTEYKKRFGTPISDFEYSIMLIQLERTTIIRTISGAVKVTTDLNVDDFDIDNWQTHNTSDWLDIVYALGKNVCNWDKTTGTGKHGQKKVFVEFLTEHFRVRKTYLSVCYDLEKMIDAKIKSKIIINGEFK